MLFYKTLRLRPPLFLVWSAWAYRVKQFKTWVLIFCDNALNPDLIFVRFGSGITIVLSHAGTIPVFMRSFI